MNDLGTKTFRASVLLWNGDFCLGTQSCPTLCDPMDCSTPGLSVLHQLLELAYTHVHWVAMLSNYLILCCPLSFCFQYLSQHQSLFQWVGSLYQVAKILEHIPSHASVLPMHNQDWFPLGLTGLISLLFKELSRVFSNTTVWKHQYFGAQPPLWSNSHIRT